MGASIAASVAGRPSEPGAPEPPRPERQRVVTVPFGVPQPQAPAPKVPEPETRPPETDVATAPRPMVTEVAASDWAPSSPSAQAGTRRIVLASLCAGALLGLVSLLWLPGPWRRFDAPAGTRPPAAAPRPLGPSSSAAYAAATPQGLAAPHATAPAPGGAFGPPTPPSAQAPLNPPSAQAPPSPDPAPRSESPVELSKGGRKARFAASVLQAQDLVDKGRIDDAERLYHAMLLEHPEHPAVRAGLGFCASERGRSRQAIEQYERALALRADYSPALIGLARVYRRSGDTTTALTMLRRYLDKHPDGPRVPWARRQVEELSGTASR